MTIVGSLAPASGLRFPRTAQTTLRFTGAPPRHSTGPTLTPSGSERPCNIVLAACRLCLTDPLVASLLPRVYRGVRTPAPSELLTPQIPDRERLFQVQHADVFPLGRDPDRVFRLREPELLGDPEIGLAALRSVSRPVHRSSFTSSIPW